MGTYSHHNVHRHDTNKYARLSVFVCIAESFVWCTAQCMCVYVYVDVWMCVWGVCWWHATQYTRGAGKVILESCQDYSRRVTPSGLSWPTYVLLASIRMWKRRSRSFGMLGCYTTTKNTNTLTDQPCKCGLVVFGGLFVKNSWRWQTHTYKHDHDHCAFMFQFIKNVSVRCRDRQWRVRNALSFNSYY